MEHVEKEWAKTPEGFEDSMKILIDKENPTEFEKVLTILGVTLMQTGNALYKVFTEDVLPVLAESLVEIMEILSEAK